MLEFIASNYLIFAGVAAFLLLGLFGYAIDRKKYEQYRNEILNEQNALENEPVLESAPVTPENQ